MAHLSNNSDVDREQTALFFQKSNEQLTDLREDDERGPKTLRVDVGFRETLVKLASEYR